MSKRITTEQLHKELTTYATNNNREHKQLHARVTELGEAVKDNRTFFTDRLDRLDNRMWMLMGGVLSTLVTVVVALFYN